jgi:phosphate:Na+ symporter
MASIFSIFTILGSLALLIYGMKVMSEGLQKAAGEQLRKLVLSFTKGRIIGLISGLLITTFLQSSTVVSVVLVGMVGVGIVPVVNSFAVIMGANIGTTVTAWLTVIFNYQYALENIIMPLLTLAVVLILTGKDTRKFWGEFLIGFAFLLMGLKMISQSTPDLEDIPSLIQFAKDYSEINFKNILLFILLGLLVTTVLQSSSATIVLTIILSSKGWLGLELGTAMILGSNIGTTLTALIVSIAGSLKGKLTALLHFLFNAVGVAITVLFFNKFLELNHFILRSIFNLEQILDVDLNLSIALALSHTTFNLLATALFLPFTKQIYAMFMAIAIKEKKKAIKINKSKYTPSIKFYEFNLLEIRQSLLIFSQSILKFNAYLQNQLYSVEDSEQIYYKQKFESLYDTNCTFSTGILEQLEALNKEELSKFSLDKIKQIGLIRDYLSNIQVIFLKIHHLLLQKSDQKIWFIESQRQNIINSLKLLEVSFVDMNLLIGKYDVKHKELYSLKISEYRTAMEHYQATYNDDKIGSAVSMKRGYALYNEVMAHLIEILNLQHKIVSSI